MGAKTRWLATHVLTVRRHRGPHAPEPLSLKATALRLGPGWDAQRVARLAFALGL